jgi:hypothetical protein
MPQHVSMEWEIEAGALADAFNQAINRVRCKWPATLGGEDKAAVGKLPPKLAQCSDLVATQRMALGLPFLARRTCSDAERLNSTWDHSKSQISDARKPCRNAIRIKVASR